MEKICEGLKYAVKTVEAGRPLAPEKFAEAWKIFWKGLDQPLPPNDGVDVEAPDGSIVNLKVNDLPHARGYYALLKAFPNDSSYEHHAISRRIQALDEILKHPELRDFVRDEKDSPQIFVHPKLVYAAATCPLQRMFLPSQLLRTIRSRFSAEPVPISLSKDV